VQNINDRKYYPDLSDREEDYDSDEEDLEMRLRDESVI